MACRSLACRLGGSSSARPIDVLAERRLLRCARRALCVAQQARDGLLCPWRLRRRGRERRERKTGRGMWRGMIEKTKRKTKRDTVPCCSLRCFCSRLGCYGFIYMHRHRRTPCLRTPRRPEMHPTREERHADRAHPRRTAGRGVHTRSTRTHIQKSNKHIRTPHI